jgi:hypothetical protein
VSVCVVAPIELIPRSYKEGLPYLCCLMFFANFRLVVVVLELQRVWRCCFWWFCFFRIDEGTHVLLVLVYETTNRKGLVIH